MSSYLFTSESVTMGHPDKVADQISDGILDAILAQDPYGRVACETLVTTGLAVIAGEITTDCYVDMPQIVRDTIREIGYTDAAMGFDCDTCAVITTIDKQSPDISQGVTEGEGLHAEQGAGDQGMMFGFACTETPELMPMPIHLAHRICESMARFRQENVVNWLRPDGKSQVTIEYEDRKPKRIHTIVVSTQHTPEVSHDEIKKTMIEQIIPEAVPTELLDSNTIYHINPTGRFVIGGPQGDCGLTGRKIIVDTYGGRGAHGGGAFSGKDPSKVDRSAAYMARHIAKNIVAAELAVQVEVELSYAIGVADPISVLVETYGTGKVNGEKLAQAVRDVFPLSPKPMIDYLDLRRPIFKETARHGHFGRELDNFTWERTNKIDELRKAVGA
jgi:S-adenosylmethionine synthetase